MLLLSLPASEIISQMALETLLLSIICCSQVVHIKSLPSDQETIIIIRNVKKPHNLEKFVQCVYYSLLVPPLLCILETL